MVNILPEVEQYSIDFIHFLVMEPADSPIHSFDTPLDITD